MQGKDFQSDSSQGDIQKLLAGVSGTIQVGGHIVDQDGNRLDDVGIEISEVSPNDMSGTLANRKVIRVNGEFQIRRSGVQTVDCGFFKEGYYDERRSYSVPEVADTPSAGAVTKSGETIVLERIPDPAPLQLFEASLDSSVNGPGLALSLRQLGIADGLSPLREGDDRASSIAQGSQIYLEPEIAQDGRLSRVLVNLEGIGGVQSVLQSGQFILTNPGAGDGFVLADLASTSSKVNRNFRKMVEAPLEGYVPYMDISGESGEEDLYFFCRIAGRYGKGVVTNLVPLVEKGGKENAYARMIIYLNHTGSRNVAYVHY
jgi:hypothetical protein